ncbi:MAG: helix-hairpin-helix domain-containing protein [Micrococcaceae bacterium]
MNFDIERAFDEAHRAVSGRWKIYVSAALMLLVLSAIVFVILQFVLPKNKEVNAAHPQVSKSAFHNASEVTVHIVGAVKKPGVYKFESESTVISVVEKAEGFLPEADQNAVNLAKRVEDGEQIVIPKVGEQAAEPGGEATSGSDGVGGKKININKASAAELEELPKIGPAMAEKIIAHRKEKPIKSLEDLDEIPGIGPKILESLKDLVTF